MPSEPFVPTERWGADLYGDPCRGCGYAWAISPSEAVEVVSTIASQFSIHLASSDGSARSRDLAWGPVEYVCHVGDNLRAWAEGLAAGLVRTSPVPVPGYDPDLLAEAKRYGLITKEAAVWSLDRAATAWCEVVPEAIASGVTLWHARRGEQRASDVARNNAHDALHHVWDVRRILASDSS